ncbi:GGDEF domain-containing protein [Pseudoxanthomonas koreensis]|uniref:GGDEF domain-containing protein n=1 Tax=Pseudoxanthomonas koreensis TaxID=266061 RepID=UPI001EE3EF2B|nr:GGDEF domain-containing protein [Pseudoxanthomonas koreensis]
MAGQMRRFERYGAASSLLMIDIDGFKRVNDSQGHVAGDQVIREVSAQLLAGLRSADAAGRYGGDEFGVLLPGTERQAAQEVAERLRQRVAAQVAAAGIPVTVSIGVAEIEDGMFTPEDWTAAADEALYRAKAAGRNRVSF